MSTTNQTEQSRADLEADIAATRERLGETVESLGEKLDVKGRARQGAADAAHRVTARPAIPIAVAVAALAGVAVLVWRRRRAG